MMTVRALPRNLAAFGLLAVCLWSSSTLADPRPVTNSCEEKYLENFLNDPLRKTVPKGKRVHLIISVHDDLKDPFPPEGNEQEMADFWRKRHPTETFRLIRVQNFADLKPIIARGDLLKSGEYISSLDFLGHGTVDDTGFPILGDYGGTFENVLNTFSPFMGRYFPGAEIRFNSCKLLSKDKGNLPGLVNALGASGSSVRVYANETYGVGEVQHAYERTVWDAPNLKVACKLAWVQLAASNIVSYVPAQVMKHFVNNKGYEYLRYVGDAVGKSGGCIQKASYFDQGFEDY